jgi:hypothetical protein
MIIGRNRGIHACGNYDHRKESFRNED